MASKVGIVNDAFFKIGVDRISRFDEQNEPARYANERYDKVLGTLLESHTWNFATYRATLTQDANAPEHGYSYKYLLPQGGVGTPRAIRVLEEINDSEFKQEGKYLLSDAETMEIVYIGFVADPNQYTEAFREAFSDYLAMDACVFLTGDMNQEQLMGQRFKTNIKAAFFADGTVGTMDSKPNGSWITIRG